MYSKRTGFTLVEIMVASTIGAFISMVAIGTLRTVITANDMIEKNIDAASEIRFASNMISRDLINVFDPNSYEDTLFYASTEYQSGFDTAYLVFYTINRTKARINEPECEIYEVEYYLQLEDDGTLSLMRRLWPNPNFMFEQGGILTKIAENIEVFEISYYEKDADTWWSEWNQEMVSLPDLIEVNIVTKPVGLGNSIYETFLINIAKSANEPLYTVQ